MWCMAPRTGPIWALGAKHECYAVSRSADELPGTPLGPLRAAKAAYRLLLVVNDRIAG